MDVEREGEGRLRIGPWVPDPLEARRSSGFAAHGTEPAADAGSADPWTDAPLAASADESGGRRQRRRRGAAPVRGRWLVLAVVGAAEFGLLGAAASTTITYACAALVLVAFCARWLSFSMLELALPRRSDFAAYWRVLRPMLARSRSTDTGAR